MGRKRSDEVKKRSGYWIESHGGRSYAKANKTVPDQCTRSLQLSVDTHDTPWSWTKTIFGRVTQLGGKGIHCPAWQSEFNPHNLLGGRRKPIPTSCPLTPTHVLWHVCVHAYTYINTQVNKCNKNYKEKTFNKRKIIRISQVSELMWGVT